VAAKTMVEVPHSAIPQHCAACGQAMMVEEVGVVLVLLLVFLILLLLLLLLLLLHLVRVTVKVEAMGVT